MLRKLSIKRITLTIIFVILVADGIFLIMQRQEKEALPSLWSAYVLDADSNHHLQLPLVEWDIWGSLTVKQDSMIGDSMAIFPLLYRSKLHTDTCNVHRYHGKYTPLYNQLDLKEVYGITFNDTTQVLKEKVTYLFTGITTPEVKEVYLEVKSMMPMTLWLNGDTLIRTDIQGLNIYKMELRKGENRLAVKLLTTGNDYAFDAQLCDEKNMARLFTEGQSGNIIFPLIYSDVKDIMLTNAHQNVVDAPAILEMYNVYGEKIDSVILQKDSFIYHMPALEKDVSYMCHLTIAGTTVRQPVLCGKDDDAYVKFSTLRKALSNEHPRALEIDQVLYRLHFLLNHPSRFGDWWWQFKISPLSYQLEYLFAHLEGIPGESVGESNVQFMTYRSKLDGGMQRYLLVTPNHFSKNEKLPLVVILRPNIDNHHHFFGSPQLARQWAVNMAQIQANRYRYIVMMPEARIYHNEELTPMAEAEIKLAIEDVKAHYPVNEDCIYLHANCSGGYRALRLATQNPEMFAAIGLYAPAYNIPFSYEWSRKRAPKLFLKNLKYTPIMIHGDPYDTHSPYRLYEELIKDCQKLKIPLEFSFKRNSGNFYNVVIAGEEAFSFFDRQCCKSQKSKQYLYLKSEMIIADLYAQPFVYVYHAADSSGCYRETIDSIRKEYENYLFTTLPLIPDTLITESVLQEKNLFLIGSEFDNKQLNDWIKSLPQTIERDDPHISLTIYESPFSKKQKVALYCASHKKSLRHIICYPWKDALQKEIVRSLPYANDRKKRME